MANDNLLQNIANPTIANLPGQFAAGRQSSLQNRLIESKLAEQEQNTQLRGDLSRSVGTPDFQSNLQKMAIGQPQAAKNIQDVFAGISEQNLKSAFTNISLASGAPLQDQNIRIEAAKVAFEGKPEFQNALTDLQNAPPEKRAKMFEKINQVGQQLGLLEPIKQASGSTPSPLLKMLGEKQALIDAGFALDSPEVKAFDRKLLGAPSGEWPRMAKLMGKGYFPTTRITQPLMDAFEAAAEEAERIGKPFTPEKMREYEFEAVKSRTTGRTAGGRLPLSRKQNIQSGRDLLAEMNITSKKLDFSHLKMKGAFQRFMKGQLQDPNFAEYMAQRADALFVITAAMKMNGVTDKAIEIEEEAFPVNSSHRVFSAWFNTQMRALNRAGKYMNEDFKYGIKEIPTYPPGQGGRPLKDEPPSLESEQHSAAGQFPVPDPAALNALRDNPEKIDEFEAFYGYRPEGF